MAAQVASYLKNVAKSVGYSAIEVIKDNNPAITGFVKTNNDTMKSAYNAIKHIDRTTSNIKTEILDSKVGEIGRKAFGNIKEDLRSGKWYNMERKSQAEQAAIKGIMGDMDDFGFEEMANGTFDFEDDSDQSMEDMLDLVGEKSSKAVSEAIIQSAEQSINIQTQLAKATAEQDRAIYANLHAAMGTINQNLGKLIEIANGPVTTHLENSKTFYETETRLSEERNSILKDMLELQKKAYGNFGKEKSYSSSNKITMSQILDENGMPDLEIYFDRIKQNIKNMGSGTGDMLKLIMSDGIIDSLIASPLEIVSKGIVNAFIPNVVKTAMKGLNDTLSGAFTTALAKLSNDRSGNPVISLLKSVLGVNDSIKTTINVSGYEKGAVPFDGITRKSIVEVIPAYLARIESALTKGTERRFDYESGKFIGIDKIKESFDNIKKRSMDFANSDINMYISRYMNALNYNGNKERRDSLKNNIDIIMKKSFDSGVIFNPKDMKKTAESLGLKGKDAENDLVIIRKMFESIPRSALMSYAKEVYSAKEMINDEMTRRERSGNDITTALFNNSLEGLIQHREPENNINRKPDTSAKGRGRRERAKDRSKRNEKSSTGSKNDEAAPPPVSFYDNGSIELNDNDIHSVAEQAASVFTLLNDDTYEDEKIINKIKNSEKVSGGIKNLINNIEKMINTPADFIAGIIKKADTAIYEMLFGIEYDENGKQKSVMSCIVEGIEKEFKEMGDWIKTKVFNPIKNYFNKEGTLGNKAKNFVKTLFGKAKDRKSVV